jgi:hypothetical protein
VNNNLRRLARSGEATDEELQEAWGMVYSEYVELSGNTSHNYLFSLVKATTLIQARLAAVNELIKQGDAERLQTIGYTGDIKKIIAKMKREVVELHGKEKELEKVRQNNAGESVKEVDFTTWIVSISKYMGYRIERKTTTVSEFLEMVKQMEKEMKEKLKKHKRA